MSKQDKPDVTFYGDIIRETEKAMLVQVVDITTNEPIGKAVWLPNSQTPAAVPITSNTRGIMKITITGWLAGVKEITAQAAPGDENLEDDDDDDEEVHDYDYKGPAF